MPRKGSKRRKTRTHVKPTASGSDPNAPKIPKSFVVQSGTVGNSVTALTKDLRKVLEPNTASRLKERKSNRLRDYVSMSGPLGVTHLLVFSQPSHGELPTPSASNSNETASERAERSLIEGTTTLNLRLIRLPRGPTLSFKVLRYSLASDILRMARRPRAIGREFAQGPLLILSGFGGEDKQLKLMTTVFQNLFPPIHVQSMPLSSARRVVLLSYNPTTRTVDFRHYVISVRPVGVSKPIRKIIAGSSLNKVGLGLGASSSSSISNGKKRPARSDSEDDADHLEEGNEASMVVAEKKEVGKGKGVLDLSKAQDISDYILRHEGMGFVTSDSEMSDASDAGSQSGGSEEDEKRGKVRLPGEYVGRGNRGKGVRGEKRAVRLVELGPRLELGLFKIEEGVGEGEVMFHEMVHKSVTEAAQLAKVHAARRKLAAERRAQQQANVEAKKAAKKAEQEAKGKSGVKFSEDTKEEDEDDEEDEYDTDFDYDAEHGLAVPSDEELLGSDTDEEDEDVEEGDGMAVDSDADDSFDEQDESFIHPDQEDDDDDDEEEEHDEDSDTDPIPISQVDFIDHPPPLAKLDRAKARQNASSGAATFKQKGFKKVDRGPAKPAVGIAQPRGPTKKELKRTAEQEKKQGTFGKKQQGDAGGDDEDGGRGKFGAGRGRGRGRDASRGGGARGGARGGRGRR